MDFWKRFGFLAEDTTSSSEPGPGPGPEPDVCLDCAEKVLEELEVQSSQSEVSDAIFYEVHSNGPNLPALPVEIFGMIIARISRQDMKNLRLVSQQCEAKVSTHYFREVVVSFRTQLFDSLVQGEEGALKSLSADVLSKGGRVFDEFGHLIRRFALALELDEEVLEYPPPKPRQELIQTFWGVYRWPNREYSRFEEVSGIENDADELEEMKKALRCLSHVTALGLCSDAGLGFLSGPNAMARNNTIRHKVFVDDDWKLNGQGLTMSPSPVVTIGEARSLRTLPRAPGRVQNWKRDMIISMLKNAGFKVTQFQEALNHLLRLENVVMLSDMHFDETYATGRLQEINQSDQRELLVPFQALGQRLAHAANNAMKIEDPALVPLSLTRSQREMLLELEWAHRAMAQSYILSAIDCSKEGCFQHLTTFNIAKIPSSHLHILSRHDFWGSFPALRNVSLGVVADWRRVYVSAPGSVVEVPVSPLEAVPLAHELIKNYISVQSNIESFHFEWICGGELAAGCHQRNQYILPAPFYPSPVQMTEPNIARIRADKDLLRLPHVKHLSLKNCWAAPHVLLQCLRDFALCSLEIIEFEGMSLSVMPYRTGQAPIPLHLVHLGFGNQIYNANTVLTDPVPCYFWDTALTLEQPSWMSWAGLIEHFSPSTKVREAIDQQKSPLEREKCAEIRKSTLASLAAIIPDAAQLPSEEAAYKLESLTFKSCGYVTLPHANFPINHMIPVSELALLAGSLPMVSEFTPYMQDCNDQLMGRIIPFSMLNDRRSLLDVFNMSMGWQTIYDRKVLTAALDDGCESFGVGRFSGKVTKADGAVTGATIDSTAVTNSLG
ncbi:hypothetical protein NLG97_g3560 [Lecanicillium saksenae]|uniref:Uncharacterized protein n=1 Tax=Lecanicillium saksenae TaxID=468837 RepID=A0ACC1QXW3_9HYPO|nr:hypothetical protein NLG97_g3560 [Lecanicillium saksenae]